MTIESQDPSQPMRDTGQDAEEWQARWISLGQPWRTQPEISKERQDYLSVQRRITPNIASGIYRFGGVSLTRADVEWLLATHENGKWLDVMEELRSSISAHQGTRRGLDLRGADVRGIDLSRLPLAQLLGGIERDAWYTATITQREAAAIHLEGANLHQSDLTMSALRSAHLEQADLRNAYLMGATLRDAHIEGADLRFAFLDAATSLNSAHLSNEKYGAPRLADARLGDANIAVLDWSSVKMLADERIARQRDEAIHGTERKSRGKTAIRRLSEYHDAVRATRLLAVALRDQGLNEVADRYAYRAQFLQRQVLRRQKHWLRYFGSVTLDLISGYGYRPLRSFITYVVLNGLFAATYALLAYFGLTMQNFASWDSPLVLSITSFHGRVFFAGGLQLTDRAARVGAIEAMVGLFIEIVFIATFTQRFFAK